MIYSRSNNKYSNYSENDEIFSTRDLPMAATFITLKFPLEGIDYQIEGTSRAPVGYFNFKNTPELREARRKYIQGMLTVEPKMFMTNLHSLKADVTNAFKSPRNRTF